MKVEIWSDFACPFCYIGKRHFEKALAQFDGKKNVEVEWKSFQLSPDTVSQPGKSIHEYLAERKGQSEEWAKEMNARVTEMAAATGLDYRMDEVVIANTHDAHRLSHLAKRSGKQNELEEALFRAYFTNGKDLADKNELIRIAENSGLDGNEVKQLLNGEGLAPEVDEDIREANQIGVSGVPFFVFDRKYAVSGAQPVNVFLDVMKQVQQEK